MLKLSQVCVIRLLIASFKNKSNELILSIGLYPKIAFIKDYMIACGRNLNKAEYEFFLENLQIIPLPRHWKFLLSSKETLKSPSFQFKFDRIKCQTGL